MLDSHEDDERDFPPSDIAALSICLLSYRCIRCHALHHEHKLN